MQILIHRNGQQSGPFSPEEIQAQLASGALQPGDLAWYEGAADWMPLSSVPGIASATTPPAAPPPMPLPRPVGQQMAHSPVMAQPKSTSGLAITSMILGILSIGLTIFTGIPAIICGHVALSKIRNSGGRLGGGGMAVAGLICGYLFTFVVGLAILAGIALPVFSSVRIKAQETKSVSNVKQIALACRLYAVDNADKFPETLDQLYPKYLNDKSILIDPMDPTHSGGYQYFGGKDDDPSAQILLQSPIVKNHLRVVAHVDSSATLQREP